MTNPTTLLFLRHMQTTGEGSDPPLSEEGKNQLDQIASVLRQYPISRVYSSDLWRAVQPAQSLAKNLGVPFQSCSALREIRSNLEFPQPATSDTRGGENVNKFDERISRAIDGIVDQNEHEHIVVVAHSGTIRAAIRHLLELPLPSFELPSVSHGGLIILTRDASGMWQSRI